MEFSFIEDEELRTQAETQYKAEKEEEDKLIQAKIDKAVEGLSSKNDELLSEKKKIQEKLQEFSQITDPQKALDAIKFLEENAEAQLIRDGKIDELIAKKTSVMRSDHESAVKELQSRLNELTEVSSEYKTKFQTKVIEDALRNEAVKAGVLPQAVEDILMRGKSVFSLAADTAEVEARDANGNLLKNDKDIVITPKVWVESLKNISPHYWPQSMSAGAFPGSSSSSDVAAQLEALAKKGDFAGYRKLREKMTAKK